MNGNPVLADHSPKISQTYSQSFAVRSNWYENSADMVYSNQERSFIIEHYFSTKSYMKVQELFENEFPNRLKPNKSTIQRIVQHFRTAYSVASGYTTRERTPSIVTPAKICDVRDRVQANPSLSTRRLSSQTGISPRSVRRVLRKLKLHPYKVRIVQELQEPDYTKRVRYCRWLRNFVTEHGQSVFDTVWYTDEAWFHLSGYVNSQNNRYWSGENPHRFEETSLHPLKIGVWCAMSRRRIVGPIFFEGRINSQVYMDMITQFIALLEPEEAYSWFQQDGARCHTSTETLAFLREFFGERLISKDLWPPRSPDLTPPDFCLWGLLKDRVYVHNPQTLNELKMAITNEINQVTAVTLKRVFANMVRRCRLCIQMHGGHFQHLL